jgi:hypothetical protein
MITWQHRSFLVDAENISWVNTHMMESSADHIQWIPCGPYANASEELAVQAIIRFLQTIPEKPRWLLLSNAMVSGKTSEGPDEIDVVAIGPRGVLAIETKHWDRSYIERHAATVEAEGHKAELKRESLPG